MLKCVPVPKLPPNLVLTNNLMERWSKERINHCLRSVRSHMQDKREIKYYFNKLQFGTRPGHPPNVVAHCATIQIDLPDSDEARLWKNEIHAKTYLPKMSFICFHWEDEIYEPMVHARPIYCAAKCRAIFCNFQPNGYLDKNVIIK